LKNVFLGSLEQVDDSRLLPHPVDTEMRVYIVYIMVRINWLAAMKDWIDVYPGSASLGIMMKSCKTKAIYMTAVRHTHKIADYQVIPDIMQRRRSAMRVVCAIPHIAGERKLTWSSVWKYGRNVQGHDGTIAM
jgi:hypothetical protein